MPQRTGMDEEVSKAYDAMIADAQSQRDVWVIGDMNAETRGMVEGRVGRDGRRGVMTEADKRFGELG